MKTILYNFSPLAFYPSNPLNWQNEYAYGRLYPTIMPAGRILPFQMVIESKYTSITSFKAMYFDTATKTFKEEINIETSNLDIINIDGISVLIYNQPAKIISGLLNEGLVVLQITLSSDSGEVTYIWSDFISMTNRLSDYVYMTYSSTRNMDLANGVIAFRYDNNSMPYKFYFECYLDTQIGKPEYNFEEESEERLGRIFVESQVSKKVYGFTFMANEHLCDALRIVKLCNDRLIQNRPYSQFIDGDYYSENDFSALTFDMEVAWEEQGDLAAVSCTFEVDNIVAGIGYFGEEERTGKTYNSDYSKDYN